jgi:hypothetical protein
LIFNPFSELQKLYLQKAEGNKEFESDDNGTISSLVHVCISASEGKKHLTSTKIISSIEKIGKLARKDSQLALFRAGAVSPLLSLIAARGQKYMMSSVRALCWIACKKP